MAVEPAYRIRNMMPGMIMIWYGSVATIPSGWHRCDGSMGTPDLTAKFVIGPGGPIAQGSTGGSAAHDHSFVGDGHSHDLASGPDIIDSGPDGDIKHATTTEPASGDTDDASSLPPYHALYYIMKL